MKLSVVLGIVHMTWGILLRGANAVYFKQNIDLVFEFLPMIIFDLALFGCVTCVAGCLVGLSVCMGVDRPRPVCPPVCLVSWCLSTECLTLLPIIINRYMVVLIFTKWCINWDERMLAATCEFLDPNTNTWVPCPDATSTCYVHGNYPETGTGWLWGLIG